MASTTPQHKLSELTERQLEVLMRVCKGMTYKAIADEFVLRESTIKTHMGNVYQKLGLDEYPSEQRRKILYEEFCPILSSRKTKAKKENADPEPVPEVVKRMVEEDERALMVIRPQPEDILEPVRPRTLSPFVRLRWLASGFVLGVVLMGGLFAGFLVPRIREQALAEQEIPTAVVQVVDRTVEVPVKETIEVPVEVTVIVSHTPEPVAPSPTPIIQEIVVTATLEPTPIPSPTPTEPVNTPPETILELGDWWKNEGVWLKLSEVEFGTSSYIEIRVEFWNQTGNDLIFEWSPTGNFSLKDNTEHLYAYEWYSQDQTGVNSEVIPASELVQLHHVHYGAPAVTYDDAHFFDANVNELYFTIRDLSRVPFAKWRISVPK